MSTLYIKKLIWSPNVYNLVGYFPPLFWFFDFNDQKLKNSHSQIVLNL